MTKTQSRLLAKAVEVSMLSDCRQKHGVVIARGKRVLAIAVNTNRNHPSIVTNPRFEASYHAEVNALRQMLGSDLSSVTLYSARTNRRGVAMPAMPCPRCAVLLDSLGVRRVFHT